MFRRALVGLLLVASVAAHVPTFNEAGSSADNAFEIEDPTKSWVFYDQLDAGEQHWFRFTMDAGQTLFTSLSLPPSEEGRPTLWVVGPGFNGTGPEGTPEGLSGVRADARDDLGVEPFSPLAMRSTAEWRQEVAASGTYYIVVEGQGTYSVAIGARESFTPIEWVTIPIERIAIQHWGGVPWVFAVVGEAVGAVAALAYARGRGLDKRGTVGVSGAGMIAGSAITVVLLATIAAAKAGASLALLVPGVFALAAFGVGSGAFRVVTRGGHWWAAALWSVAGFVVWAGLLLGPILVLVWAAWRPRAPTPVTATAPEP